MDTHQPEERIPPPDAAERYHRNMLSIATDAFDHHYVREYSTNRWLLMRPLKDGGWDGTYATEIVALWRGSLLVHGDIDTVIFARYTDTNDPIGCVRWIGTNSDIRYYAAQKAAAGTGRELVYAIDDAVFAQELRRLRREYKAEDAREAIDAALNSMRHGEPLEMVRHNLATEWALESEDVYALGKVVAPRVYFAHAALKRLCHLIDTKNQDRA